MNYNKKEDEMCLYLFPDLEQHLYLRIDFWKRFNVVSDIFNVEEINPEVQAAICSLSSHNITKMHD